MNIAENSAMTNSSSILGKLHLAIPLGAMGILLVMVLSIPTMIMDLLISLNIALSIVIMPVLCTSRSRCIFQNSHHSSFSALPGTRTYL
jgi:flagellar biosynthesis component FlhA